MNVVQMIHSVPPVVSLIIVAVLVAMSGIAVAASLHARKIARTIAYVKTSQIATATDAYLALEGTAKAVNGQMLTAPLTDAACCWFDAKVEEYVSSGDNSSWNTLGEHFSSEPFLILDATGECAMCPDGAEVTPTDRSVWYGPTARTLPSRSISNRTGIEVTENLRTTVLSGSSSTWKVYLCSSMYFLAVSTGSPSLIASTTSPLSANSRCASWTFSICSRHGAHQVAQKFTSTGLPFSEVESNSFPASSCKVKAGAPLPTSVEPGPKGDVNSEISAAPSGGSKRNSSVGTGSLTRATV